MDMDTVRNRLNEIRNRAESLHLAGNFKGEVSDVLTELVDLLMTGMSDPAAAPAKPKAKPRAKAKAPTGRQRQVKADNDTPPEE